MFLGLRKFSGVSKKNLWKDLKFMDEILRAVQELIEEELPSQLLLSDGYRSNSPREVLK